jgi:toxin ParE1/3/4
MKVIRRPLARLDLIDEATYLEENASLEIAERFLDAAEETFVNLARLPLIGSTRPWLSSELTELRQWRVKDFEDLLIFYLPLSNGVEVVRVIHAKRDLPAILANQEL